MQVFASKDAEIEDLRKRLAATEKQRAELEKAHAPCDDLIASLRKQLAALELTRDYAKVSGPRALHPANRASHVWMYYAAVPCSSCCTCSQSVALARYGIG
jgi:septal ring factor EnvC (AmiA/AmiB activator)